MASDIRLRPITEAERHLFATTATDPADVDAVRPYVDDLVAKGAMRPEWCFLCEPAGRAVGRVAFWTLPGAASPSDIILFDLSWAAPDAAVIGIAMLDGMAERARMLGAATLGHVLDTPRQAPQWQGQPEQRAAILATAGFEIRRETLRFQLDPETPIRPPAADLVFRSMAEVGEATFRAATDRVVVGTLDRRAGEGQEDVFADVMQLEHDAAWWDLAYTADGALIGQVMPILAPRMSSIGHIGVVPEMRGRGYVDQMLARGMQTLMRVGHTPIIADTDTRNVPMANAFRRAGWRHFATRTEYGRPLV